VIDRLVSEACNPSGVEACADSFTVMRENRAALREALGCA
jgi:hypothetical protein